ncbi:cubilin-like [Rhopilema esculentum]|uniref:cubilin-like n=1 Tax=Rhopilema esculentum TaxID=499914 RepID=UPI0031DEB5B9
MGAVGLCLTAALLFQHAYALCSNQYLNATTTSQLFSYQSYTNNEYCRIQIAPSNNLNSSEFFLEIKWIRFDIKGQMPDCREDFVEVHLTRSEQNIGKFCSSNMKVSPFTMYSHDGFAELIFSSDKKDTGNGFSLSYRLQRKDTQALRKPEGCIFRQESSSLYYTDKWPRGQSDTIFCFRLIKLPEDQNLRISIMDLDLSDASSSGSSHCTAVMQYIQIRESDEEYTAYSTIESYASSISNILCKRQSNNIYIGKKKFVYILEKSNAHSANRGFLIGYTFYTAEGMEMQAPQSVKGSKKGGRGPKTE